eukprot:TRINITY_DN39420_c0_g3_i1.p1 TRINITY_DN39420_c0_g3~~TRINITY_DN39420_c0_g3_i1.p1  ORF type:complete len:135 (+),score=42.55 TRINITY_DN39420_c0_g3_i1:70-474(+)
MSLVGMMSEVAQLAELAKGGNQCKMQASTDSYKKNASSTSSGGSAPSTATSEDLNKLDELVCEQAAAKTQEAAVQKEEATRASVKDIRRPLRWVDEMDLVPKQEHRREASSWTCSSSYLLRVLSAASTRICTMA